MSNHDTARLLRRIKKCLALSKSANANEAATALRQAQKLMREHGISMSDVELSDVSQQTGRARKTKDFPRHLSLLIGVVARAFGCRVLHEGTGYHGNGRTKWHSVPVFIGLTPAPELAKYAYDTLARQLERDRKLFALTHGRAEADSYADGWVYAVREKVTFLVPTQREIDLIDRFVAERHGNVQGESKVKDAPVLTRERLMAIRRGMADGEAAQLHHGMGTQVVAALRCEPTTEEMLDQLQGENT